MSQSAPPAGPAPKVNRLGLNVIEYRGAKTTLCAGCGHNAISERILEAMFDMGIPPERMAKFSGIGCSSKSPAYFMSRSHAFNALHGRMPSVATGAILANRTLLPLGVSGDGDTASIGIGQFVHLMRRNLRVVYIIENNGVYGLTKGQFSATADVGSKLKTGVVNDLPPIDTCALAIQLGATFVGRSFSGDKKQLSAMLKAAIAHRGTSMLDVVSPCVTFNDHEGSTKSYAYMKDHDAPLQELSFIPAYQDITVEYDPGTTTGCTTGRGSACGSSRRGTTRPTARRRWRVSWSRRRAARCSPESCSSTRPRRASWRRWASWRSRSRRYPRRACGRPGRRSTRSSSRCGRAFRSPGSSCTRPGATR